jgi:hypothetical protein
LIYKSVLLSTVVSTNGKRSQNHITKTIGANRDSIQKTMVRRIHVHHIGENIWGSLPRKCQCDVVNDEDWELIMKWWETSMTISPNQKGCEKAENCSKDIRTTCNTLSTRITNTVLITFPICNYIISKHF